MLANGFVTYYLFLIALAPCITCLVFLIYWSRQQEIKAKKIRDRLAGRYQEPNGKDALTLHAEDQHWSYDDGQVIVWSSDFKTKKIFYVLDQEEGLGIIPENDFIATMGPLMVPLITQDAKVWRKVIIDETLRRGEENG